MSKQMPQGPATVIPTFRYRNARAAIDWLCGAFGFEKHAVYAGEGDQVAHAQLTFGNGMIMLSSEHGNDFDKLQKPATEGAPATSSPYIIVEDADAHHARAVEAGARIVYALRTEDYGGRGYSCLDLEGHLWSFGTYDPWPDH